ncbi:MAG: alpha-E domain-containing protein [Verrucomicrobiota bacterium]|nr:alpha-E domain-containing protein [Verrucomicrobiota bacterium]
MLCRVADSLFWMSRYIERAENTARLMDVNLQMVLESEQAGGEGWKAHWEAILRSTGDLDLFNQHFNHVDSASVTEFLTFSLDNPSSVISCINAARENARQIRDQITSEMWEVINRLYLSLKGQNALTVWNQGPTEFYNQIKEFTHLFHGLTDSTFPRGTGYEFMRAGTFLERAEKTGRILDIKYWIVLPSLHEVGGAVDLSQWAALLRATSALDAYRWEYVREIEPCNVAELLVLSRKFPRSIRFCLEQYDTAIHNISKCPQTHYSNEAERLSGKLLSDLNYTTADEIITLGIHEFLESVQAKLGQLGIELNERYMFFPVVDPAAEATAKANATA